MSSSLSPAQWTRQHLNFHPDPTQSQVLDAQDPLILLNCSRQWGKTTVIAAKALHFALFHPKTTTLVAAPSERQSLILLRRLRAFLQTLAIKPAPIPDVPLSLRLPNGSEIIALPASADTIRGFTAHLLIFDEAARVPDSLYHALSPTRATTGGPLWLLSTPNGPDGFFYEAWHEDNPTPIRGADPRSAVSTTRVETSPSPASSDCREPSPAICNGDHREQVPNDPAPPSAPHWARFLVPATECPRIAPAFLDHERLILGDVMFRQEYLCEFIAGPHTFLSLELIESAIDHDLEPLFTEPQWSQAGRTPRLAHGPLVRQDRPAHNPPESQDEDPIP
jgi:hypothetical protein